MDTKFYVNDRGQKLVYLTVVIVDINKSVDCIV